ncbi:MAG TPA: 30S ribosomal protein S9 [Planctomycetia bacterium]|nr:30S ribosomal protein S9 [Planctomycetia bacterium]
MANPSKDKWTWGTGRRKTAVARVRITPGSGVIEVNDKPLDVYFTEYKHQADVLAPLRATGAYGKIDVFVNATGGGISGQSGAVMMGLARALKELDAGLEPILRDGKFLTRDSRMKERKKYGQKGARRRFQFSKR